ncbi:MAG: signal peptidase I [Candidatus Woesearchaeota archaeon]
MKLLWVLVMITCFLGGMVADSAIHLTRAEPSTESPADQTVLMEKPSPGNWVPETAIKVGNDHVVIDLTGRDVQWSTFTDTNSMDPVLDAGSNGIEVKPNNADEIDIGDIVAYKSEYSEGIIIHRVVEKSYDRDGVYFTLKGDNNPRADPGKVRFEQIQRVLVAIIY